MLFAVFGERLCRLRLLGNRSILLSLYLKMIIAFALLDMLVCDVTSWSPHFIAVLATILVLIVSM